MTALHPTADELELYVTDLLGAHRCSEIEDHVVSCDDCSKALASEARLEVALEQVAAFRADRAVAPIKRVKSVLAATVIAAAAMLVVFAGEAFNAPAPEQPAPAVVAPPSADAGMTTLANNDSGTH